MGTMVASLKSKADILVAVSVVFVIMIMIVPLNSFFIDMFLSMSISVSLLILFISMYIKKPLDFSVFPSVLLIVTLFRLSLNIASTRLI
nr:FHIPEP family type III secretion protein [Syntrophorhabdaceae bacterium]